MPDRPVDIWRRKLEHLLIAEAKSSDPAQLFSIRQQIKEAERCTAELQSESRNQRPQQVRANPPAPVNSPDKEQPAPHAESDAFDFFLSHNSHDKPAVRELKQRLIGYRITIWLDEDELQPGMRWQVLLEHGIRNSSSIALLIGKDGLGPWEDEERQAALRLAVRDKRPVIPVLLPGAPSQPELPMFFGNRTWADLRGGFTDGGLGKLVRGITAKKPDEPRPAENRSASESAALPEQLTKLCGWLVHRDWAVQDYRDAYQESEAPQFDERWIKILESLFEREHRNSCCLHSAWRLVQDREELWAKKLREKVWVNSMSCIPTHSAPNTPWPGRAPKRKALHVVRSTQPMMTSPFKWGRLR